MWPSVVGALYSGQVVVGGDGIDVGADDDDDEYKSIPTFAKRGAIISSVNGYTRDVAELMRAICES